MGWRKEKGDLFRAWVEKHQIGPSMNDKFFAQRGIIKEVPKLYTGRDGSVGDGWIPILDRLATDLIAMGWDRDLHQVKEKFGGLRFYVGVATDAMHDRIRQAEKESYETCEECGQPGKPQGPGWILTLCVDCSAARAKYEAERNR